MSDYRAPLKYSARVWYGTPKAWAILGKFVGLHDAEQFAEMWTRRSAGIVGVFYQNSLQCRHQSGIEYGRHEEILPPGAGARIPLAEPVTQAAPPTA